MHIIQKVTLTFHVKFYKKHIYIHLLMRANTGSWGMVIMDWVMQQFHHTSACLLKWTSNTSYQCAGTFIFLFKIVSFNFMLMYLLKSDFLSVVIFLAVQAQPRFRKVTMIFWLHLAFADLCGELLASDDLVVTVGWMPTAETINAILSIASCGICALVRKLF